MNRPSEEELVNENTLTDTSPVAVASRSKRALLFVTIPTIGPTSNRTPGDKLFRNIKT
jgi:hypothetical protein